MAADDPTAAEETAGGAAYQVLARKHRPADFDALIGQDAMVRTLRNAFASDRIAHAFVLTGVRGVGKTTTARIIAKCLNCIGPDGGGGPTVSPCGVCEPCRQIAESRHVDVMEMDAASRTGVGDVREIIDAVRYRAASARYKVYIIDEVHMLSTSAFNALLKTLEEPPPHVKFVFATTEIRKVPVTVLSRCQRFDLRRIEPEMMIAHLGAIAAKEGATVAEDALAVIARAAEGSVRDALSLLDQAIANGSDVATADQVREMIGLADRGRVIDLFETIMRGDCAGALRELGAQYADGADPLAVLRDLAELTHWISVVKISPEAADDPTVAASERDRGRALAEALGIRQMTRMWQMLLKALDEVARAPNAMMAAEMAVIRLTHVAELPSPEELVRRLEAAPPQATGPRAGGAAPGGGSGGASAGGSGGGSGSAPSRAALSAVAGAGAAAPRAAPAAPAASPRDETGPLAAYARFEDVVALIRDRRDGKLLYDVETFARLASYAPGRIEFAPAGAAPGDLASRLATRLTEWTGARWMVSVLANSSAPTIAETRAKAEDAALESARLNPLVAAALAAFPGARISAVRPLAPPTPGDDAMLEPPPDAAYEDEGDDWEPVDPFQEE